MQSNEICLNSIGHVETPRAGFTNRLYVGLGPQDPRGPPTNCCTHRVNCRYM